MKTHYLANLTWRCQNQCSYCWVNQTVKTRAELVSVPERSLDDWARAIHRDKPDLVDLAGGEPCLFDWLPDLFTACPETLFGLSTNGLCADVIERILAMRPKNLAGLNISYHPESVGRIAGYSQRWRDVVRAAVRAGARPRCNIVCANDNEEASREVRVWLANIGGHYDLSPYEGTAHLGTLRAPGLRCEGGINHLTMAPDGAAWPCLTALRSPYWRETCLGNWIDGPLDLSRKPQPCYLDCADYYILATQHPAGEMWRTEPRPWEGAA